MYMERNIFRLFIGLKARQEVDSSQARSQKPRRSRKNVPYLKCKGFSKFRNLTKLEGPFIPISESKVHF
jgi:hypothetical protein